MEERHSKIGRRRRFFFITMIGAVTLTAIAVAPFVVSAQGAPTAGNPPPPGSGGAPPPLPSPPVEKAVLERAQALIETGVTDRVDLGNGIVVQALYGPATRGKTIQVAGQLLKLPDDAELGGLEVESLPPIGAPPGTRFLTPPVLLIKRGEARFFVSTATGEFSVARGIPQQYDFLLKAFGVDKMVPR